MSFGILRRYYSALPLRLKLTLANTLVMLLIALIALLAIREGLRLTLSKELEIALREEADFVAQLDPALSKKVVGVLRKQTNRAKVNTPSHIRHGWFWQLFDEDGKNCLVWSEDTPKQMLDEPIDMHHGSQLLHISSYYITEQKIHAGQWIRLGSSTAFIDEDVNNVTRIMVPVLGLLLLLAPLGGYILAARATSPLQKIIRTTESLHPKQLDERLIVRGTGDELDKLSEKINHFLDQIADYLDRNREFVANAAHELRSPLAAIKSSIDVALTTPRSLEEYQELLSTVHDECRQLSVLVNQLLTLAESDAGFFEITREEVPLDKVVTSCVNMFEGVAEDKEVLLQTAIQRGVVVMAEASRLRQVINNLIDNAIKFTSTGGHVRVRLSYDPQEGQACVAIADTGIGIPTECLPRVFDRFYQVDRSRYHETVAHGTGLGLSICQSIIQAYGGEITVTSKLGEGTEFAVHLPGVLHPQQQTIMAG